MKKLFVMIDLTKMVLKAAGCITIQLMRKTRNAFSKTEAAWKNLYSTYKSDAKRRNLLFEISLTDLKTLSEKNCYICGQQPMPRYNKYLNQIILSNRT